MKELESLRKRHQELKKRNDENEEKGTIIILIQERLSNQNFNLLQSKAIQEKKSYESVIEFKNGEIESLGTLLKQKKLDQEEDLQNLKARFQHERNDFRTEKGILFLSNSS